LHQKFFKRGSFVIPFILVLFFVDHSYAEVRKLPDISFGQEEEVQGLTPAFEGNRVQSNEASFHNKITEDSIAGKQEKGMTGKVLSYAKDLLGIPYRFGGTTVRALDCSAFVQRVFRSIGIGIPRTAREQFKIGRNIDRDEISEGDLVFFMTRSRQYPSHVGIYIGDNQFIHASRKGRKVSIENLDVPYYRKRFVGAKRLIELEVTTQPADNDKSG
jgi:cell wall-associated NlpC family hydrolase